MTAQGCGIAPCSLVACPRQRASALGPRQGNVAVAATYEGGNKRRSPPRDAPAGRPNLPKSGYFAPADPNAPVIAYRPRGAGRDPLKKGGRFDEEFIWNTDWKSAMEYEEDVRRQIQEAQERREQGSPGAPTGTKGFVSLGSLASLDDVSVDLSDQLRPRNVEASSAPVAPPAKAPPSPARPPEARRPGVYARLPPSKGEARRWDRSRAAAGRPVVAAGPATEEEMTEEQRAKRERNAKRYEELKVQTQLWTVAIAGVSFLATRSFYPTDVSTSYLVGAIGGLIYLRSLSRSVDALGGGGQGAAAAANPRLLIPVILVLGANRWNELKGDEFGVHLAILPELLGFFTYKAAVVGLQFTALMREFIGRDFQGQKEAGDAGEEGEDEGDGDGKGGGPGDGENATSVDRAFISRVTWG